MDRFDANSLLYVTRAIDYFDLAPPGGTLRDAFAGSEADYLFLTFSSDWLYPPRHLEAAAEAARVGGPVAWDIGRSPATTVTTRSCSSTRRRHRSSGRFSAKAPVDPRRLTAACAVTAAEVIPLNRTR